MRIDYDLLNNKIGIYMIINTLNGKKYVGSSRNLYDRLHGHVHHLKRGTHHNKHLQAACNKYGIKNFDYSILEYCEESKVFIREQYYIDCLKPEYNKSDNVIGNLNTEVSQETREKIRQTLKRKYKSGELVPYKQQHLWKTCYVYNIDSMKLIKEFKNIQDASLFLTNAIGTWRMYKNRITKSRCIVTTSTLKNHNELIFHHEAYRRYDLS